MTGITFVPYLKRIFGSILYAKISKNSYCLNMSYGLNECLRREDEKSNEFRVLRGGAFYNSADLARCAFRSRLYPSHRLRLNGFRCCVCAP